MRILIVDDHALFRVGLRMLLSTIGTHLMVIEVATVAEALAALEQNADMQLCLLDLALNEENGLEAIQKIKDAAPEIAVVVVSGVDDNETIRRCIDAGAMSFVPKSVPPEILTQALQHVLRGTIYLPPTIFDTSSEALDRPSLTPRQTQVLRCLSKGLPTKLISHETGSFRAHGEGPHLVDLSDPGRAQPHRRRDQGKSAETAAHSSARHRMTPGASAAAASVPPKHALLIEILDLHARGLLRMPWIQALIVLGIGLFIVPSISLSSFTLWAVSSVGTEALRARYASGILRREFILSPGSAHAIFVGLASLDGLVISAGAVIFLPQLPVMHQALLGVVLFALPAAGVAVSSSRYILGAYAVCVLLPAAITWAMLHPSQSLGLAALSTAYCATIFFVSADGEKLVLRSVVVRHERDQLVRDLEQRNEQVLAAVAQAERSAQARARVLAAASHDLRQPLHALSLYSAVLAANPTPETVRELSRSVDQIVRSLGSLLNGLLDLSRLSAAHYVPEQQVLDLETLLRQICAEYQHVAAQKQLLITHDLTPIRIACDPIAVGRIARNLMDNAIKYTERGGISVATRLEQTEAGCFVVLSVADSGRGIPAAEQERIFEEFYQIDNPGRDHGKGVGLGLAIVRRLCELIGGTVQVNSQPGQGTRFDVRFPATLVDDTIPGRTQAGELAPSFPGRRIYVVDDEPEILRSMQKLLGAWSVRQFHPYI